MVQYAYRDQGNWCKDFRGKTNNLEPGEIIAFKEAMKVVPKGKQLSKGFSL